MATPKESLFILTPINFKESKESSQTTSLPATERIERYDPLIFCRTCANMDPCLVPIFKEEGLEYCLNEKIEKYLPIQVSEEDDLPVHLCYHCASTLIAWDTLVVGCVEAEKKLMLLKDSLRDRQCEVVVEDVDSIVNETIDSDDEPLISKKTSGKIDIEEKRDILQEKNTLQEVTLEPVELQSERLMEEPDLSFSTYQHQFTMRRPFLFQILNLRTENPFCCNTCAAVRNVKLAFVQSSRKKLENAKDGPDCRRMKKRKLSERAVCDNCGKVLSSKLSLKNHMKTHCSEVSLTCHKCGKAFRHRFNLLRHLRVVHEGVRNHVCTDCGKRYRSHGEMEDHRNVHNVQQKIICEECGRVLLTKASFYAHKKFHRMKKCGRKEPTAAFDCGECHKKFTTKKSRNQHLLIHTGEKPLCCTVCGKKFRTKANFTQHAKVHSDVKPYGCEHCGKAFGRKDHLKIHVRCHTGEKPFVCDYCGRGFAQMNDMKKHCRIHEKRACTQETKLLIVLSTEPPIQFSDRVEDSDLGLGSNCTVIEESGSVADETGNLIPEANQSANLSVNLSASLGREKKRFFKCDICKKAFNRRYNFARHLLVHTGETVSCPTCGKQYRQQWVLERHIKVIHQKIKIANLMCNYCSKMFSTTQGLEDHCRTHTGERPFICEVCGKDFRARSNLLGHKKIHSGETPFACTLCDYRCRLKSTFVDHCERHEGTRKFLCSVCGKGFINNYDLTKHKKIHSKDRQFFCTLCGLTFVMKRYLQAHLRTHARKLNKLPQS